MSCIIIESNRVKDTLIFNMQEYNKSYLFTLASKLIYRHDGHVVTPYAGFQKPFIKWYPAFNLRIPLTWLPSSL